MWRIPVTEVKHCSETHPSYESGSAKKPETRFSRETAGELKTRGFVEEKNEQKVVIKQTIREIWTSNQLLLYLNIVSGSAAYSLFIAASAGLAVKF